MPSYADLMFTAAVQAEIDAGKDIEAVLDAAPLTPWVEDWAWGFINEARFTRLIFADLSAVSEAETD